MNQTQLEHEGNPSAVANLDLILRRANLDLNLLYETGFAVKSARAETDLYYQI